MSATFSSWRGCRCKDAEDADIKDAEDAEDADAEDATVYAVSSVLFKLYTDVQQHAGIMSTDQHGVDDV